MNDVSVAILAGGQSRRMGTDKSFIKLNNRPLIEHVLQQVQSLKLPLFIVANNRAHYEPLGYPVFSDVFLGKGSLGGIYSAIHHSSTAYTLCVACDMPFLVPELLRHLIELRHDYDAVVPEVNRRLEPLHAVFSAACLNALKVQLQRNELAIYPLFHALNTRIVSQSTLVRFDPGLRSFVNVNTPDDLEAAQRVEVEL